MKYYFLLLFLAFTPVFGRTWTNAEGQEIEAEFQVLKDGKVGLLMGEKVIFYPLEKLSLADQNFAKEAQAKLVEPHEIKSGFYRDEKITSRLFPEIKDYFKDSDRKRILAALEGDRYWPDSNGGKLEDWAMRDEEKDLCSFYVPKGFKKGAEGYGLLLVIDSGDQAIIPEEWFPMLDELKLVAVGSNRVGNENPMIRRVNLSMDALATARERFGLGKARQIVTGISGGGHMAMLTAAMYPEEFLGAISHAAQSYLPSRGMGGHFPDLTIRDFKAHNRRHVKWVVISGEKDYNYAEILKTSAEWEDARLTYRFIDVPGMAHHYSPVASLKEALIWVEAKEEK